MSEKDESMTDESMRDSRLKNYALTAGGVAAVAAAGTASCDIMYTSCNLTIDRINNSTSITMAGAVFDFRIETQTYGGFGQLGGYGSIYKMFATGSGGGVAETGGNNAFKFNGGDEIGASFASFDQGAMLAYSKFQDAYANCNWDGDHRRGFLGVNIGQGSDVRYGWIDVQWDLVQATILGYAWESDTNTSIAAGDTTTPPSAVPGAPAAAGLIGLAVGAAGIRRRRSA